MYPPFEASWQTVIRPSTSFPLPPLKFRTAGFPQYGFKPVLAPATFTSSGLPAYRPSLSAGRLPALFPPSAGLELLLPSTGPVALGSPSGCIVRSARRLLWPHLRLCWPPNGLWIIPSGGGSPHSAPEGPQFTLPVLSPMPSSVLRWSQRLLATCLHRWCCLRQMSSGSATTVSHHSGLSGERLEAATFALCYGLE